MDKQQPEKRPNEPKNPRRDPDGKGPDDDRAGRQLPGINTIFIVLIAITAMAILLFWMQEYPDKITYDFFVEQVEKGNVASVVIHQDRVTGEFIEAPDAPLTSRKFVEDARKKAEERAESRKEPHTRKKPQAKDPVVDTSPEKAPEKLSKEFYFIFTSKMSEKTRDDLHALLEKHKNEIVWEEAPPSDPTMMFTLIYLLLPVMFIVFLFIMFRRSRDQMMGGGFLSGFSKSPAKRYGKPPEPTTFDDVAGLDSVKKDLQEVIEFLQNPEKFERLGGQVPKGMLLLGPPGTGKTLLARAVAGEAEAPFFSVNGSEFIQMFVGVGASRVRDLFNEAKENAPAIIFIDEIDAVGRQRGAGLGGGHDEREQTLNQILGEMDGFGQSEPVIVIAATNRPDVLDPALLRPGRFDRHVTVDRPTRKGREAIFKVHVRDVPLSTDVDIKRLAAETIGMTGADIRNLVNEAALWAARYDKTRVEMDDFEVARDKIIMGPAREDFMVEKEKEKTARHEAGHALVGWLVPGADPIHKVTIIPRGRALGVTMTLPEEDRLNITEDELHDRLAFCLGGREAERIVYGVPSTGDANDLERATALARRMVTQWGMSERLGPVSYKLSDEDPFLGREMHAQRQFSEHTMQIIDEEVARILHDAAESANKLLRENRDKFDAMTAALLEQEEIDDQDLVELIGPATPRMYNDNGAEAKDDM